MSYTANAVMSYRRLSVLAAILFGLVLWAQPVRAQSVIASGTGYGNGAATTATTGNMNNSAATLLIASCGLVPLGTPVTISSSPSTSWTSLNTATPIGVNREIHWWYAENPTTSGAQTVSCSGDYPGIAVIALDGTPTTSVLDTQTSTFNDSTGTTVQAVSLTPGQANNVLVTTLGGDSYTTYSIDSGFSVQASQTKIAFGNTGAGLAIKFQTSATASAPTWTANSNDYHMGAMTASFKTNSGGGGATSPGQTSLTMLGVGMAVLLGLIVWRSVSAVDDLRIAYDNAREQSNDMQLQALRMQYVRPETPRERVMARLREQKPPTC
jgi:hypothetical protein